MQALVRTAIGTALVSLAVYLLYASSPPTGTYGSSQAISSALCVMAIVAAACTVGEARTSASASYRFLFACTVFAALVHLSLAVLSITGTGPVLYANEKGKLPVLTQLTLMSLTLFAAAKTGANVSTEVSLRTRQPMQNSIVLAMLLIWCGSMLTAVLMPVEALITSAVLIAGLAGIVLSLATVGVFLSGGGPREDYNVRMALASAFMVVSLISSLLVDNSHSELWVLVVGSEGAALAYMGIASGNRFLRYVGVNERIAYISVMMFVLFTPVAFISAHLVEEFFALESYYSPAATILIHLGAGLSCIAVGTVLYSRSKSVVAWYRAPVLFMILSWGVIEFSIVVLRFLPLPDGVTESVVPYLIGGIVANASLVFAIRRILRPLTDERLATVYRYFRPGFVAVVLMLIAGELIQRQLFAAMPGFHTSPLGGVLLTIMSSIGGFSLAGFLMLMAAESGGKITVEGLAVSSQSLWLVSLLLRANFSDWTSGWWAAEGLLATVATATPIVLTWLYLGSSRETQELKSRAELYSELTRGEIMRHHRTAVEVLHTLSIDTNTDESRLNGIASALTSISRAHDVARLLVGMQGVDAFGLDQLDSVDLADSLTEARAMLKQVAPDAQLEIDIKTERESCLVLANELLSYLVLNMLKGIVRVFGKDTRASVRTDRSKIDEKQMVDLRIQIRVVSGNAVRQRDLLRRYLEGGHTQSPEFFVARQLTHLFHGTTTVGLLRGEKDNTIELTLSLPVVSQSSSGSTEVEDGTVEKQEEP
ncbi:MAG: hypothetical protein HXY34_02655 [Candidatus Thorarchaeota archaeon]|nr:hypothetical protein [Candidatus Thorarchaeota archaeon]